MTKVKVIELVGQKLDPKAKYIFVINQLALTGEDIDCLYDDLNELILGNYAIVFTAVPVEETMKVYEVLPRKAN